MPLKDLYYLHFPREGDMLHHVGPQRKHQGRPGGRKGQRENISHSFYCVCFPHKSGQGRGNSLASSTLSNVSGLWAKGWSRVV